jgi:uncharacterized protein YndB with AHSA1/START domain
MTEQPFANDQAFVYVSYIRTTPEQLWRALTSQAFIARYWFGAQVDSDWSVGSKLRFMRDGKLSDSGEVLEADPPRRLSYSFKVEWDEDMARLPHSRVTFELEPVDGLVKLSLVHDRLPDAGLKEKISGGWPKILSGLKTLLETDDALWGAKKPETADA